MRKIVPVLMAVVLIAGVAWASTGKPAKPACTADLGLIATLVRLDLTEVQKRDLARIFKAHREQFRQALKELGAARSELRAAMAVEVPQGQAVSAAYRRSAAAGERLVVLLARIKPQLRAVLTARQRAVWDRGRRQFLAGLSQRIDARRQLFNQWIEEHVN